MPLSDIEIKAEIAAERLVFKPPIPDPDQFGLPTDGSRFGSSSIDLLLHEELIFLPKEPQMGVKTVPSDETDVMNLLRKFGETKILSQDRQETIYPFVRVIGKTLEYMILPHISRAGLKAKAPWLGTAWPCIVPPRPSWQAFKEGCT